MLGETPMVDQRAALGVGALDHHAGRRRGAAGRVQDTDLEVDQPHVGQLGIDRDQRLAQRSIEGIHRAVALAHLHRAPAGDVELHRRLGQGDQLAAGIDPPLGQDAEALQAK